jgi:hypothetical protein
MEFSMLELCLRSRRADDSSLENAKRALSPAVVAMLGVRAVRTLGSRAAPMHVALMGIGTARSFLRRIIRPPEPRGCLSRVSLAFAGGWVCSCWRRCSAMIQMRPSLSLELNAAS